MHAPISGRHVHSQEVGTRAARGVQIQIRTTAAGSRCTAAWITLIAWIAATWLAVACTVRGVAAARHADNGVAAGSSRSGGAQQHMLRPVATAAQQLPRARAALPAPDGAPPVQRFYDLRWQDVDLGSGGGPRRSLLRRCRKRYQWSHRCAADAPRTHGCPPTSPSVVASHCTI